jgi:hypothetical protein
MPPALLNLNLKWLGTRIPEGAYYPKNMFLLLLFGRKFFSYIYLSFKIIRAISWQCFVYGHKLDHVGFILQLSNGDVVPSFNTIC